MHSRILLFFFFLSLGTGQRSAAQYLCPPNIDFEFGDLSHWNYYVGSVATGPVFTLTSSVPTLYKHTLTSGTGLDPFGLFPIVDPGGGAFALCLGSDSVVASKAERAVYNIRVPAGINNYSLIYRYAVVLEDPGNSHLPSQKPTFRIRAYDSASGILVPCAEYYYIAGALPGFLPANRTYRGDTVYYKPWSTGSINLSGYAGKTVAFEVTNGDCTLGGHFGYGYIDLSCGFFAIDTHVCDDTLARLKAPPGFQYYTWFDSLTFTHIYGTTEVLTMPTPDTATTYAVVLQPFINFGCPDTLYTRVIPSHLNVKASNDTLICESASIQLYSGATDSAIAKPLIYAWSPATGLTCTACDNPIATPLATTTYTVTVTDKAGCVKKDMVTLTADKVSSTLSKVNDSCNGSANGSATITTTSGIAPYSYRWSTVPLQTGVTATGLTAGTYTVTVTDNLGCTEKAVTSITEPPPNNLIIVSSSGPTRCNGSDGYIVLSGLTSGKTYTLNYTYNTTPQVYVLLAGMPGTDTIKGLSEGVYDKITVDISLLPRPRCPFNSIGPLTLLDPPVPPLPAVGNNGPVCLGDTLKLSAKDAVAGVSFEWEGPGGFTWDHQDTSVINAGVAQAGTYTVTVSINGCHSFNTTTVVVKPVPQPSATGDTVCTGTDVQLSATSANGATGYRWAGPDAYSSFVQNAAVKNPEMKAAGTYTVIVTLDGCVKTATADVIIVPTPPAPVVTDTTYCRYHKQVSALQAAGTGTLIWYNTTGSIYPGIPIPNTDMAGTTTWYVDDRITGPGLSNQVVCISPKTPLKVTVVAKYLPELEVTDSVICTGNEITFTVKNTGDDPDGIRWSLAVGDSINNVNPLKHSFDAMGTYSVSVTPLHKFCPSPTLVKVINVFPYPVLDLGPDTSICLGGRAVVLADRVNKGNTAAKWLWNTGEVTSLITVTTPGTYYSKLLINGCPVSDTVTVLNDCYLDIPNAFTPNGDGTNDHFFPRQFLTKGLISFNMDIYNRWGQIIFSTNSINGLGWDGRFNGVPQPEGVYVFIIDATFKDGQKSHHTGNLTLLR